MFSTPRKKPIGLLQKISPLENTDTCIIILKHIRAPLSFSSVLSPLPYRLSLGRRSMDGLRANSADTTKSITCHNVCLVIFTDRTYSCMLCARATWPLSIFRSLSWSAWDDCRNWWNASDNFHCSWATLCSWHSRKRGKRISKVRNGDSVGGPSSGQSVLCRDALLLWNVFSINTVLLSCCINQECLCAYLEPSVITWEP